jgi:Tfp pilus assembly PilM family ATPase
MSHILAIDWDRHEARGLLLSTGPTGSSVEGAWAVSLTTADMAGLTAKQIGARLAAAMSGHLGGKLTTIIGAGRDHAQMKLMSLPPAPSDELPDMVRFQAEREFTALGSDAALDFIPLSGDAQTPHQVLAVAMSPAGMTEVRELCQSLGVEADRIALRACGAGALAHRAGTIAANKVALVVNPLTDEADLTVQAGEHVHLMRTVRLPDASHGEGRQRAMIGEIRRTIAAARQQMVDSQVEEVVLCCSHASADLANNLSEELEIPVTILDPVASAPSGLASQGVAAESLARFAAVLGVALAEADRRPPIVDFINFRRRREAQRFTRTHAIAAAAAAIAVLGIGGNLWLKSWRAARELAAVQNEIQIAEQSQKQYEKVLASADAV